MLCCVSGQHDHAKPLSRARRLKPIGAMEFKQVMAREQPWTLPDIVDKLVDCCDE
jgi:hypothetical protein